MGKIIRQTGSEIKQLPLLLCKLLGGIMAATGLPGAVYMMTRRANPSLQDILPYLLAGAAGTVIFVASSRALARRVDGNGFQTLPAKDKNRISVISWLILLILAAVFLLFTYFVTK